tara:strand:+ start:50588 stop:51337 length:750 start_codon:yes stop_codon:yes gene_type:complete
MDKKTNSFSFSADYYRSVWDNKPSLRRVYESYYKKLLASCVPGKTLEIGGGNGHLHEYNKDVIITDIQISSWVNISADAQKLPFKDQSFDNIILLDVLHHIEFPYNFFNEAERILRPGGRVIMIEPGITIISSIILHLTHPEPIYMRADPWKRGEPNPQKDPFDANQALPTIIFFRNSGKKKFLQLYKNFKIVNSERLSLFAYPLSGGFRKWSLIPALLVSTLLRIEATLMPFMGPFMAFRVFIVLQKN